MIYCPYPPGAITPTDIALLRHRGFLIEFPGKERETKDVRLMRRAHHLCIKCGAAAQFYENTCRHGIYCVKHARENAKKARQLRKRKLKATS